MTDAEITAAGRQLLLAVDGIATRHGWSAHDSIAVALIAVTELAAQRLGPVQAVKLFQDHADAMFHEHNRRAAL